MYGRRGNLRAHLPAYRLHLEPREQVNELRGEGGVSYQPPSPRSPSALQFLAASCP